MKPGLAIGHTVTLSLTIPEAMGANLLGNTVHPHLYGTASMVEHMEYAARQHILPYLEPGEEGVGYRLEVSHLQGAPVGAAIEVHSRVIGLPPKRVVTDVSVVRVDVPHRPCLGRGIITQALVPQEKIRAMGEVP